MNALFEALSPLWDMSLTAAWAAGVVFLLRLLLKKRAPKRVLCLLWLVVFVRLWVPVKLESPVSLVPPALSERTSAERGAPTNNNTSVGPDAFGTTSGLTPTNDNTPAGADAFGTTSGLTPTNDNASVGRDGPGTPSRPTPTNDNVPAPSVPETPAAFPWKGLLAGVWLAGTAAMLAYGGVTWFVLRRRVRFAVRVSGQVWEDETVTSPFIFGLLRPRVYLPIGLEGPARRFILCHEFAHLRRFDHVVKPLCWLALAVHWFNPAVWLAFLLMSRDMEAACDEAVLRSLGERVKADYSCTLLALASGKYVPAPCPLAFDEGDAKGRIKNVLNYRRPALWILVLSVIAVIAAAVCLLTNPVAENPAPTESGSGSDAALNRTDAPMSPDGDVGAQADPWMLEVLRGERTFSINGADRDMDHLAQALFDGEPREALGMVTLAMVDLDRDGANELIFWPFGEEDNTVVYQTGHLILRLEGGEVRGYRPAYDRFCQLAEDGTFYWTVNKYNYGSGRARFEDGEFTTEPVTWSDTWSDQDNLFVDNQPATQEEFDAAIEAQLRKPGPTWYVLEDGKLVSEDGTVPLYADAWMLEVLSGERTYRFHGSDRSINVLDDKLFNGYPPENIASLTSKLALVDLDRDGARELVLCPMGENDDTIVYNTGYLILRQEGDTVQAYTPGWRSFYNLVYDGTFHWSNSAFEGGTGRAWFEDGEFTMEPITWVTDGSYFVDNQPATEEEYNAAIEAHDALPEPFWYTFENGVLGYHVSIPVDNDVPVPDFLDADQQLLYRQAYVLYRELFSGDTWSIGEWPGPIDYPRDAVIELDEYIPLNGRYAKWEDFEAAVLSVFTEEFWNAKNRWQANDGTYYPIFKNVDGRTWCVPATKVCVGANPYFPDTFHLPTQTDTEISFVLVGHYSEGHPLEGESFEERDARLAANWEEYIGYPMKLVLTEHGWRFDEFHCTWIDNDAYAGQAAPNPALTGDPTPEAGACVHGLDHVYVDHLTDGRLVFRCQEDFFPYYPPYPCAYDSDAIWEGDCDGDGHIEEIVANSYGTLMLCDVVDGEMKTFTLDPHTLTGEYPDADLSTAWFEPGDELVYCVPLRAEATGSPTGTVMWTLHYDGAALTADGPVRSQT